MISVTQDEELSYLFVVPEIVGTNVLHIMEMKHSSKVPILLMTSRIAFQNRNSQTKRVRQNQPP